MADRVYIEKARKDEIRSIVDNKNYLPFDNNKEAFQYALSLGMDLYNGGTLNSKEGYFLMKDMHVADEAFVLAIVAPEMDSLEALVNTDLVYSKAEGIADKGFSIMIEEMGEKNTEAMILTMLNRTNEMYDNAKENGLLEI